MSRINEQRTHFKPFEYPWAFDYYLQQQQMHWLPTEVSMADDISDWKFKMTDNEKNLVTQVLRFFTQGDCDIANAYVDVYMKRFKHPELRMMMTSFASTEAIHVHAYSYLIDTLGMPEIEYKAFQNYKEMLDKHQFYFEGNNDRLWTLPGADATQSDSDAFNLAKFSAFGEGLQLFSSFLILMNFQRFGKLKGLGQIVAWSARDESLHCEAMIRLFNEVVNENPKIWNDQFKKLIYDTCREMVNLEDRFIELSFKMGEIQGLKEDDVKRYIRYIADRRLLQLGLKPNYGVKDNPCSWFDEVLLGNAHTNFFEQRVTEYSKGVLRGDWSEAF